jgi:hypothetical protein
MKDIVRRVKELIEAAEPDMTVEGLGSSESFTCPVAEALWLEYRQGNPDGLTSPPKTAEELCEPCASRILPPRARMR